MKNQDKKIIKNLLKLLPKQKERWCVEFGAWDGIAGSNIRNLILNQRFYGIFIEGNPKRYALLAKNYQSHKRAFCYNAYVGFQTKNSRSLDNILKKTEIPLNFDFLSVDVDGNDYHIWKSLTRYRPKVICIEINPSIPKDLIFIQEKNSQTHHGTSLAAMDQLGQAKGYQLVAASEINAFFVDRHYLKRFRNKKWPQFQGAKVTYLFAGLDGTVFL